MTVLDPRDPFLVSKLAERAPRHDPTTCQRRPCSRCTSRDVAVPPPAVDHEPARQVDRTASPFTPLVPLLLHHAPQVNADLAKAMLSLADGIRDHGTDRWHRLLAWESLTLPHGISLIRHEPGVDPEDGDPRPAVSLTVEKDRAMEAAVSRYAHDLRTTAAKLPELLAALPVTEPQVKRNVRDLRFLLAVAEARKQRRLLTREQTAAQVALDGWCKSCYRVGVFDLIDKRPTGEPYYVDLCRWCGSHKGGLPQPPIDMVKLHHRIPERRRAS